MPSLVIPNAVGIALALQGAAQLVPGQIVTDRPDFTESSSVVLPGFSQLESGITWTGEGLQSKSLTGPEVLIRLGMTDRFELRFGLPNYNIIDSSNLPQRRGWDDLYVGFKYQLGATSDGTNYALIPAVVIPVGSEGIRSEVVSPELKFVWSRDIGSGRALSGMIYVSQTEFDGKKVNLLQHTISVGMPLREKVGMFVEHVFDAAKGERASHLLHLGFTYQPKSNVQFDVHFGFGLSANASETFLAAGYSVRF